MRPKYIPALLASLLFASCSEQEPLPDGGQEEYTYSFTAMLDGAKTRVGYEEDSTTRNLKMVWDEDDVIRLYPDASMNDTTKYYTFTANTGAGTSHTVFVHQGYIKGWEHWSGKAIYTFPGEENLDVDTDEEKKEAFLAKSRLQIANDNTEHLKYAEHTLEDGTKKYTEYWSDQLTDYNLKHDYKLTFNHPHTVVYKIMLRGFIYDILNGSQLIMSGDAWPDGEETVLTLGVPESKEEPGVFLKVGDYTNKYEKESYTKDEYDDKATLIAYMIRQVKSGTVDGQIKSGEKLKFKLLVYDPNDGKVMIQRNPLDVEQHRDEGGGADYFTNIPWAEEYLWTVTVTDKEGKVYESGDYVVADLTEEKHDGWYPEDQIHSWSYDEGSPRIAVDMGHRVKWATYNVRAESPDDYGLHFVWGYVQPTYGNLGNLWPRIDDWKGGDPEHDAATDKWGSDWRMPTMFEMIDLLQYTDFQDGSGNVSTPANENPKYASPEGLDLSDNFNSDKESFLNYFWNPYWYGSGNRHQVKIGSAATDETMKIGKGKIAVVKAISRVAPSRAIYLPIAGRGTNNSGIGYIGNTGFFMTSPIPDKNVHTDITKPGFSDAFMYMSISSNGHLMQTATTAAAERCYTIRPVKEASQANPPYDTPPYPYEDTPSATE